MVRVAVGAWGVTTPDPVAPVNASIAVLPSGETWGRPLERRTSGGARDRCRVVPNQKYSFRANCMIRGSKAACTRPNVEALILLEKVE